MLLACIIGLGVFQWWTDPAIQPSGTLKIYDRDGILHYEQAGDIGRKRAVTYGQIPQHLRDAVVSVEDERFWTHPGIDPGAMLRALRQNTEEGRIVSGASTITQQVARLAVLRTSVATTPPVIRKIREVFIALRLSILYSKQEIVTMYLNEVYLGNHNYGVGTASEFYFRKSPERLSVAESALLAGMISSPGKYDPYSRPEIARERQRFVLNRMIATGALSREAADEAAAATHVCADRAAPLTAPPSADPDRADPPRPRLPATNVSVYTTLDTDTFTLSERVARYWVQRLEKEHNVGNTAVLLLENKTGAIISMVGGVDYFDESKDGQVNGVTALHQPGSAIKPVTYLAAFNLGFTPASRFADVRRTFSTKEGKGFIPNNAGDVYHGPVLAREALGSSFNVPAVDLLQQIGIPAFLDTARNLGITSFTNAQRYDLAITLGGAEVSLLELTGAYATIANAGTYTEPYAIERIVDASGTERYRHSPTRREDVLGEHSKKITYLITDILADNDARIQGFGENSYLRLSRPAAVKTGTTTDWHDIWAVGYTPSYTLGVWTGNTDNTPMRSISSTNGAAPVWNAIFEQFLEGSPEEQFPRPDGIGEATVCRETGPLDDGICQAKQTELFLQGTVPTKKSTMHQKVVIDRRNGLLAGISCPGEFREERILPEYPDDVFTWAATAGKEMAPREASPLCSGGQPGEQQPVTIAIYNPRPGSLYQHDPTIQRQGISFEVNTSSPVNAVEWYVNDMKAATVTSPPFSYIWPLQTGRYRVYAVGKSPTAQTQSVAVSFEVVE